MIKSVEIDLLANKKRSFLIDAMKGMAILLVIIGHTIQGHVNEFDDNIIFRWIYSFHMPMFMGISGFLAFYKVEVSRLYLKRKFNQLMIPCLIWFLIDYFINHIIYNHEEFTFEKFFEFMVAFFKSPDYGLWFLWVLFLNFCLLVAILFLTRNKVNIVIIIITVWILNQIPFYELGLGLLKWHSIFFLLGYWVAKNKDIFQKNKNLIIAVSFIFYPWLLYHWHRIGFHNGLDIYLTSYTVSTAVFLKWVFAIATPIFGSVCAGMFIKLLEKNQVYTLLVFGGRNTLELYAIHSHFINHPHFMNTIGSSSGGMFFVVILDIILSTGVIFILKRNKKINHFLFGKA